MVNKIKILGCNGTKGMKGGTTAFQLNADHVIDAGNLLRPLGEAVAEITTVWLTHSHLDHIVDIAYILDTHFSKRKCSLVVRGLPETIEALKKHFLNDLIWPDFSKINLLDNKTKALVYEPIEIGTVYSLDASLSLEAYETDHTVASCGYIVTQNEKAILITADTYDLSGVVAILKKREEIKTAVVECSFPSSMSTLARESKHLTPELLFKGLKSLEKKGINLKIHHIKPLYRKIICDEISLKQGAWKVQVLEDGENIHF